MPCSCRWRGAADSGEGGGGGDEERGRGELSLSESCRPHSPSLCPLPSSAVLCADLVRCPPLPPLTRRQSHCQPPFPHCYDTSSPVHCGWSIPLPHSNRPSLSAMEATKAPWATVPSALPPSSAPTTPAISTSDAGPVLSSSAASTAAVFADIPPPSSSSSTSSPSFHTPVKGITSPHLLSAWKQSEAYADIVSFILRLNEQVKSKPSTTPHEQSERVRLTVELLERAKGWVKDIPPIQQAMRFGNKAFRTWHSRMMEVDSHTATQHSTRHCDCSLRHSTAQHSTAQHSTAQHSTAQHSTAQHSTAQHSTAQHSTIRCSGSSSDVSFSVAVTSGDVVWWGGGTTTFSGVAVFSVFPAGPRIGDCGCSH